MLGMVDTSHFQSLAFDFKTLDVFQAVYRTGSMTEAGRYLGMTQSAVSQAITRLEGKLNAVLFVRERPLVPTPSADTLMGEIGGFFDAAKSMENQVRSSARVGRPLSRVGMVDSFAATIGPKLIPRLRGRSDQLTMWAGISANLERELVAGKLDVLIGTQPLTKEKDINSYPLLREPYFVVLPEQLAQSMSALSDTARFRDLVHNHTFVRYSQRSKIGVDIEKHLRAIGQVPPQSLEFDGTEAAFSMVKGGLGWMISTPLCLIHGTSVEQGLTTVPLPAPALSRTLYLLARKDLDKRVVRETLVEAKAISSEVIARRLGDLAPWALDLVKAG